jgi:hypothetical protein
VQKPVESDDDDEDDDDGARGGLHQELCVSCACALLLGQDSALLAVLRELKCLADTCVRGPFPRHRSSLATDDDDDDDGVQ